MPILVRNIRLGLEEPEEALLPVVAKRLAVSPQAIRAYAIIRRSLDARRKEEIHFTYQVELELDEPHRAQRDRLRRLGHGDAVWLEPRSEVTPVPGTHGLSERPIIVGFGPGGMLAALRLAQFGYEPIVLERGRDVTRRHLDVMQRFFRHGHFDPTSNLLFGEGGAGTYSDGKLYTRINDPLCRVFLETLYQHGADPDILVSARPHIGSDRLPTICTRIRDSLEALGGSVRFECQVTDLRITDGRLEALRVTARCGTERDTWLRTGPVVLAIGHSARDTIRMLARRGVWIEPKPFQIGVRIEHPQAMVDRWQYGAAAGHRRLGPAEYHLVAKDAGGAHGDLYSFCMCPGGMILPTNESAESVATNGASRSQRSGPFANSGLVITVLPEALALPRSGNLAIDSLAYLTRWERRAFEATGGSYQVPAQRACDFLAGRRSDGALETSYPLGGRWAEVSAIVPEAVTAALHRALPRLARKFPGFCGADALITGPETRASAPVRIVRDSATRQAVGTENLYPVGEGAGYAGGIVSAAVDGIKTADAIIRYYAPPQ